MTVGNKAWCGLLCNQLTTRDHTKLQNQPSKIDNVHLTFKKKEQDLNIYISRISCMHRHGKEISLIHCQRINLHMGYQKYIYYLWINHFYCLCDYSDKKQILKNDGSITNICHWANELLVYHFTVIHRLDRMMADVGNLNWRLRPLLDKFLAIAARIRNKYQLQHPK